MKLAGLDAKVTPMQTDFYVRELQTEAEIIDFLRLADIAFSPEGKTEPTIEPWMEHLTTSPDVLAGSVRGAFAVSTDEVLGGYVLYRRQLCVGSARLPTGCIGGVVTAPEYRNRGIASALMDDSVDYAQQHGVALLLLTGIPNFYHRWGFVAVREESEVHLERKSIRKLTPPTDIEVRPATEADAEALLSLYHQHFLPYVGSFERSLRTQRLLLRHDLLGAQYSVACDTTGAVQGYLLLKKEKQTQVEVAANNWPALSALLCAHEHMTGDTADERLTWSLPLDSPIFYHLMERIPARSERWHHFNCDWMARPGHVETLVHALLPVWTERLRQTACLWQGNLILTVETMRVPLTISGDGVTLCTEAVDTSPEVKLTAKAITQLCFGFRPVSWFASQLDQQIPNEVQPVLETFFPPLSVWVAGSDYF